MPDLTDLDRAHVWHPFTPMRQWCDGSLGEMLIIERAEGMHLIDTQGRRYIDGVSSLWCNVHGHRVPAIDQAIRDQLDRVAHSTLLGLANVSSIELAAQLVRCLARLRDSEQQPPRPLNKVFYSDAGATAVEAALKMAVGYWHHRGRQNRTKFIALRGAYHGDTTGSMAVGFSEAFHRPYSSMVFPVIWRPAPDPVRDMTKDDWQSLPAGVWPSEHAAWLDRAEADALHGFERLLREQGNEIAAVIVEPIMQGAAGMMCHRPAFLRSLRRLVQQYNVLFIADEVATGFGRTAAMFACEHAGIVPDILCLAKGITGGYLPLAATITTDEIYDAFRGEISQRRTFFHGHTYTGNPLGCAAALASLQIFEQANLIAHIGASADIIADRLNVLRDPAGFPQVIDVRQRGAMVGIELARDRRTREPFDSAQRVGAAICAAMRPKGLIIRPLGDVVVLMPIPAMPHDVLHAMLDIVIQTLGEFGSHVQQR